MKGLSPTNPKLEDHKETGDLPRQETYSFDDVS